MGAQMLRKGGLESLGLFSISIDHLTNDSNDNNELRSLVNRTEDCRLRNLRRLTNIEIRLPRGNQTKCWYGLTISEKENRHILESFLLRLMDQ
jgi:hypothetical protein